MKATSLSLLVRNSMGFFPEVISAPLSLEEDECEYLKVDEELDPERLRQLQVLVLASGWELAYTSVNGSRLSLVIIERR